MGRSRGPTARTNKDEQTRTLSLISKKKIFFQKKIFWHKGGPLWSFLKFHDLLTKTLDSRKKTVFTVKKFFGVKIVSAWYKF